MSINLSINKNNYYSSKFRVHKKLIPYFRKEVISKTFSRDTQTEQQNTPSLALGTTIENQFDHQQEQLLLLTI